jgi:hypothetical protein
MPKVKGLPLFRFTIRDVLWLTVVVAVALAFWVSQHRAARIAERQAMEAERRAIEAMKQALAKP